PTLGKRTDGAREDLIDEELHVGAAQRDAVRDARHAELRRIRGQIDAAERACHDLDATDGLALAAVLRADGAGLELLALAVGAERADAAVVLARRAVLVARADAVAAALARATVRGAGEAVLRGGVALPVAAAVAHAAIGRAREAVLGGLA